MEVRDLQQRMRFLQEQLAPVTRQREYQEKEIQRLNKVRTRAHPLTVKCLLCSQVSSSLSNPKRPLIIHSCSGRDLYEALHIPLGSQEGGFKEGLLSLLPLPNYTHFPRWAHARGPPETPWALSLL